MKKILLWFRRDLRMTDNPALYAARQQQIIPIYIHAPEEEAPWQPGAASRWWLHHSLAHLAEQLKQAGSRLIIREGPSLQIIEQLIRQTGATAVFCNRLYEPAAIKRDTTIKCTLSESGIEYKSFAGNLLFEPWSVLTKSETPYKVFTPFWNTCQKLGLPSDVQPGIKILPPVASKVNSLHVDDLGLLPKKKWDEQFYQHWQPGERHAQQHLRAFIKHALLEYGIGRDFPARATTSRLSPHLHFGEISPRQIVYAIEHARQTNTTATFRKQSDGFLRELIWREFTHHVLYHFPQTPQRPLNPRFEKFPWTTRNSKLLTTWRHGQTGFPIIDAGMRELWATGYMHNRVRMIVGSILTKNMNHHWLSGARWFWDTLVDADLAQNTFNWQWIAGCGADAAPYFRIFNPVTQSEKFDAHGEYIRRWVPELRNVPGKLIHAPWTMSDVVQKQAQCVIGRDYPQPVVDLKISREDALLRYRKTQKPD